MTLSHEEFERMMTPAPLTKEELEMKARVRAIKFGDDGEKVLEVTDLSVPSEVKVTKIV